MKPGTAVIITIGDELLMGQVIDTNSAWLAQQLEGLGIKTIRKITIPDDGELIKSTLKTASELGQYILITGGLGPTKDDLTKKAFAEYFNTNLVRDEKVYRHINDIYNQKGRNIHFHNLDQALIPEGSEVLWNRVGTAPGMWFEKENQFYLSFPGVPYEMKNIFTESLIPKLKEHNTQYFRIHRYFLLMNISETDVELKIKRLEDQLPENIKLAFLPNLGALRLRLSGSGTNKSLLEKQMKSLTAEMESLLGNLIVAEEDIPIEKVLGRVLRAKGLRLGFAESCTGGLLASRITDIPGSSEYFYGSIVSYDNSVKENLLMVSPEILKQFGAVSEETVLQMAKQARISLNTDITLAVSGILGPGGGTKEKPVGTVWMAISDREKTEAKCYHFYMDRLQNKQRVLNAGFGWLLRWLKE